MCLLCLVLKARSIAALDPNGKSDPYCIVIVDGSVEQQQKTETINATLEPEWNKSFKFSVTPPHRWSPDDKKAGGSISHYVKVDMWDHDRLNRDDFLGTIMLPLVDVTTNTEPIWYMLSRNNSKQTIKGEIKLKLYFTTPQVSIIWKWYKCEYSGSPRPCAWNVCTDTQSDTHVCVLSLKVVGLEL